jgi:hypothetical protein
MAAIATLQLDIDGGTTNVDFIPSSINANGIASWFSIPTNVFDDRMALSLGVRQPANGSPVGRTTWKLVMPIMNATDSAKKDGEMVANLSVVVPKSTTSAQRDEFFYMLKDLFDQDACEISVTALEGVY